MYLHFVEHSSNKLWSAHLVLYLFVLLVLRNLTELSEAIPSPTVKHLIMIECKTVVEAALNIGKLHGLLKRLHRVHKVACMAYATFTVPVLAAGKCILT